jgi:hypothetical protein
MAIESGVFGDVEFTNDLRVGNTCGDKLCANPEHLIMQTHTDVLNRKYGLYGTGPKFNDKECLRILDDYHALGGTKGVGVVKQLCKDYECNHQMIYRMMDRARKMGKEET